MGEATWPCGDRDGAILSDDAITGEREGLEQMNGGRWKQQLPISYWRTGRRDSSCVVRVLNR